MVKEAPGVSGDGEIRRWGDSQMGRFADGEKLKNMALVNKCMIFKESGVRSQESGGRKEFFPQLWLGSRYDLHS